LNRKDITIIESQTKGLSKSRNIALLNCKTEYALIADDDIEYITEGLEKVIKIIQNESPDFATFKIKTYEGQPEYKDYPKEKKCIDENYEGWLSSIEILLNIDKIKTKRIKFDQRFGLGTLLKKGEENILIYDLLTNGLKGIYYPIYIVKHPFESSGKKATSERLHYFLKGCITQRTKTKTKDLFVNFSTFRKFKNMLFFHLGKLYINVIK